MRAGVVEAVASNVTAYKPGDRVVASLLRACGRCGACLDGLTHLCRGD
jgi:Zn-dependent alcohol dehydrogenase